MTEVFIDDSSNLSSNSSSTTSNNPSPDISLQNITNEDVFELIGQNVLSNWDSESEFSISKAFIDSDPLEQLKQIFSLSPNQLPTDWDEQVKKLLKQLTPTDYAIYGQQLCLSILNMKTESMKKKYELKKNKNASKSSPSLNLRPKKIPSHYQSSKTNKIPKSSSTSRSSILLTANKAQEYSKDKPFNRQIYTEFPPWLPTLND